LHDNTNDHNEGMDKVSVRMTDKAPLRGSWGEAHSMLTMFYDSEKCTVHVAVVMQCVQFFNE